jgi:acetylornithine deacetylase/succinyl-diaminopimelate desuccinylase-like protein
MTADRAIAYFDQHREEFLQDLLAFLRFPTISAQSQHKSDIAACAEWIKKQLAAAGLQVEIIPTKGHPVVFADSGPAASKTTILFYGHYDVQPIGDEKLWKSPAFEPQIRDGIIFARGSADDKGQVMTHLAAVRSWKATGEAWPIRIKFLIEGEEEIGSPNLPTFVCEHREKLSCDYVVLSDTGKLDDDTPALAYASRGLVYKEVVVDGPGKDLHSGHFGGAVMNPANALAQIIAALHDAKRRVTIPGFYDQVAPLSEEEKSMMKKVGMSDAALLEGTGSSAPIGEEGFTTAERRAARPTLDVNGIYGGYTGEGSSTIIPSKATAKISMRLVAHQDPTKISAAFDQKVRELCPPGVRLEIKSRSHCAAYMAPMDSPGVRVSRAALEAGYGRPAVLLREGGTLPILPLFKEVLGADSLMLGFADPNCNLHSPNEFFHVADLQRGTRSILHLLAGLVR